MSVSSNQTTEEYRGKKFHQGGKVFPESSSRNSHSQRWEGDHTSEGFSDQGFFIGGIYGKTGMTDSDENSSFDKNKHTSSEKIVRKVEKKRHGRRNSVGSLSEFDWRNECSDSDSEEIDSEEFQKAFLREKEAQKHRKNKASLVKGRNHHGEGMTKEILLQLEKERNFRQRKGHHGQQTYDTSFDPSSIHKKDLLFHAERERNFKRHVSSQEIDSSHSEGMTREILQQLEKERKYERSPHASYIQDTSTSDEIRTRELALNLQKEQNFDRKMRSSFGASTSEESQIGTRELVLNLQKEQNFDRKMRSSFGASTSEESQVGTRELLLGLQKERSVELPPGQGFSTTRSEETESQEQFDNFLHGLERERDFERNLRVERLQKEIEDQKHHNQQYEENHQASIEFFNRRPELGFGAEQTSESATSESGWGDKTRLQAFELESVGSKIQQQLEAMSEQIRDEIYKGCKKIRRTQRVSSLVAVEEIFAAKNESVQELELIKQEFLEYIAHRKDELDNTSTERTLTSDADISVEIEKIRREQQNMLQMVQSLVKMVFRPQN